MMTEMPATGGMTSLVLLLWIASAITLQLAIYLGIGFWRHWKDFRALKNSALDMNLPMPPAAVVSEPNTLEAAWSGWRTFKVARKGVEDAAKQICSFELVPQDGRTLAPFLPGQFLTFRLEIPALTGGTETTIRCYSLSDAPRPGHYRVSIKRASAPADSQLPPGRASNFFHDQVPVGSLLQVRAPAGHFYIDQSDAPVVLIAGGIGITPSLSMLNWCLTAQPGREIWLFYGVRHRDELVMKSHLESLAATHANFHLRLCLSHPTAEDVAGRDYQHGGRVDVDLLRRQLPLKPYHFYICGPTPMMESLVPALEDWGVPDGHIHFEAFGPASIQRKKSVPALATTSLAKTVPASDAPILVNFAKSGKQLAWHPTDGLLLDFAQANGIVTNSGCRAGGCGSCQTTIRAGEVTYRQAPDFDPEPGTCLLCVCMPKTSVTLEL